MRSTTLSRELLEDLLTELPSELVDNYAAGCALINGATVLEVVYANARGVDLLEYSEGRAYFSHDFCLANSKQLHRLSRVRASELEKLGEPEPKWMRFYQYRLLREQRVEHGNILGMFHKYDEATIGRYGALRRVAVITHSEAIDVIERAKMDAGTYRTARKLGFTHEDIIELDNREIELHLTSKRSGMPVEEVKALAQMTFDAPLLGVAKAVAAGIPMEMVHDLIYAGYHIDSIVGACRLEVPLTDLSRILESGLSLSIYLECISRQISLDEALVGFNTLKELGAEDLMGMYVNALRQPFNQGSTHEEVVAKVKLRMETRELALKARTAT